MHENQTVMQKHRRRSVEGVCRRCDSHNIVGSRHRGIEGWVATILPMDVYRCVECYSRFWMSEPMFASGKRVAFWSSLLLLVVLGVFLRLQLTAQTSVLNRTAEFIPQFDNSEQTFVANHVEEQDFDSFQTPVTAVLSDSGIEESPSLNTLAHLQTVDSELESEPVELSELRPQSSSVENRQKSSVARLEKAVVNDTAALASLLKVDMNYRVERWRGAWESGLADYYLTFYSDTFKPENGLDYKLWVVQRNARVKPEKKIKIELSNFSVSFSEKLQKSTVIFDQHYRSANYSELSRKSLVWVKEEAGWRIVSETQLK